LRLNWRMEKAFWASETLVDQAFGSKVFRVSIDGIRDDEEGPQIDLAKNVLPNLGDRVILLTDNVVPASPQSDRMLVAIELQDSSMIVKAIEKEAAVDFAVTRIDDVSGVPVWEVTPGSESADADDDFFEDLLFEDPVEEEQPPLLDRWAVAVVPASEDLGASFLVCSSHIELLTQVVTRMRTGQGEAMMDEPIVRQLLETSRKLSPKDLAMQRLVLLNRTLRTKYELMRRGEWKDSDSILSSLFRRLLDETDGELEVERPDLNKWPVFESISKYLGVATSYVETTDQGWELNGFLMRSTDL
ncbi:MAG: membrane or secreted protein, partial [Planctomycetota bacterium]